MLPSKSYHGITQGKDQYLKIKKKKKKKKDL